MSIYQPGPKLVDSHKSKLRFQWAAGLAAIAVILTFIAFRFETEPYVKSEPVRRTSVEKYQDIWFTARDTLAGANRDGARLEIHRWAQGAETARSWNLLLTGANGDLDRRLWTVSAHLERAAWIAGGALHIQALAPDGSLAGKPISVKLSAPRRALALTAMTDGALAAVFDDAAVLRWNAETGAELGASTLPLSTVDRATASGDYIAVASFAGRKAVLFRYREGWTAVETSTPPEPAFEVSIPAPGVLATLAGGSLRMGGDLRNTPGAVRTVASFRGHTMVTGDFEKVLALHPEEDPYDVAEASAGSLAAAGRDYLGVTGPAGTAVLRLTVDQRLTVAGRGVTFVAAGLCVLSGLLLMLPFLLQWILAIFNFILRGKDRRGGAHMPPEKLGSPPPELVAACAAGEAALWAGAGLSAQAGLSDRRTFISHLLQTAAVEGWLDADRAAKLVRQVRRGEPEEAVEPLTALDAGIRSQIIAYIQSVVPRYVTLSRSHEMLEVIPFQAILTTNYDTLLDRLGGACCNNLVTLHFPELQEAMTLPFLLKLYGHVEQPGTVLLARAEMQAAARRSGAGQELGRLLATRTLLFVGCSLDRLLKDLDGLSLPEQHQRRHFAVAAGGRNWQAPAGELRGRYGIEPLVCREDRIASELPAFLEALVREMGRLGESQPPAEVSAAQETRA